MTHPTWRRASSILSRSLFVRTATFDSTVASIVGIALLLWTIGAPFLFPKTAYAVALANISDTIIDSAPSVATSHVISFIATTTLTAGNTIKIQFDPAGDAFNLTSLVTTDATGTGLTVTPSCSGNPSEVTASVDSSAPDENITFTVCTGDTIAVGTKTITLQNAHILNPAVEGSYVIRVTYGPDSSDTRVAIIQHVVVTASVDTSFIFTIVGVIAGDTVNGDTDLTATATTPSAMEFGSLASGTPVLLAQDLTIITNARNGFSVTVREDQNLTNGAGADIDVFNNGLGNVVPTAWASPTAVFVNENTWGHIGVTSEDSDLNGDEFGTALYAGNFATTTRTVFSNSGPADGVTPDIGYTRVGYKLEVSDLQEAALYTNQLIYVATPTF
jgi:hypothetical protein